MRSDLHLDISEIAAFGTRPRSEQCDETMRHLLKCRDCRSLLPLPKTKELWRSILEERRQSHAEDTNESAFTRVTSISRLFGRIGSRPFLTPSAVFAAALFLAIAGLSMLLMFDRALKRDDGRMAQITEIFPGRNESGETPTMTSLETGSNRETGTQSRAETEKESKSHVMKQKTVNGDRSVTVSGTRKIGLPAIPTVKLLKRSETRGSSTPCGENSTVGLVINVIESVMRLEWGKVTGATSYAVYLSDLDERLIDKFETEGETSYMTNAKLDPETTYKWKLVVSLKGGRTILATSRNFRLADLKDSGGSPKTTPRKKTAQSVRCSEDKQ